MGDVKVVMSRPGRKGGLGVMFGWKGRVNLSHSSMAVERDRNFSAVYMEINQYRNPRLIRLRYYIHSAKTLHYVPILPTGTYGHGSEFVLADTV